MKFPGLLEHEPLLSHSVIDRIYFRASVWEMAINTGLNIGKCQ